MREALVDFKSTGKWIVAFGELWQEREYYLASAADEIYMVPEAMLFLDGFRSKTNFYADLLEKYGIGVQVEAYGEYKSFADSYRRTQMSEPHRIATSALLAGIENNFIEGVSEGRGLERATVESGLDEAVYQPEKAVALDLVDDLIYRDQVNAIMAKKLGVESGNLRMVEGSQYLGTQGTVSSLGRGAIAVIYASGAIQSGSGNQGFFGDTVISSESFIADLKAARENKSVKAIVIRIDSPGGSALASDVMWREIQKHHQVRHSGDCLHGFGGCIRWLLHGHGL